MKAQISMQETLAEAQRAITGASRLWRTKPEKAKDELRYARAMLITAERAIIGELEITDK
jgi:hypothetical protein